MRGIIHLYPFNRKLKSYISIKINLFLFLFYKENMNYQTTKGWVRSSKNQNNLLSITYFSQYTKTSLETRSMKASFQRIIVKKA